MQTLPIPAIPPVALPGESWATRLFTGVGSALDAAVLRGMQLAVDALLMPAPDDLPELRASAEALRSPELLRDPARFFDFDAPRPGDERGEHRRSLAGGSVVAREVELDYHPYGAGAGDPPQRLRVPFEHWVHEGRGPRGSVIAVHGFTMGRPRIDGVVLMAGDWFRRGLDVALVTLPHHGARTPAGARFSGEHFAVPDVARMGESVRQAVFELRALQHWLRGRGSPAVGVLGLSLGGYLTSLMAGLYDDLAFAVPIAPPACVGDLAWRFFRRSRRRRDGREPAFSHDELRTAYRVHSPLAHPLRTPRERVLIVAGRGDRIVPPEHPNALWQHWGHPSIHWFSGGHLTPFGRPRIVAEVSRHLRRLGVL